MFRSITARETRLRVPGRGGSGNSNKKVILRLCRGPRAHGDVLL